MKVDVNIVKFYLNRYWFFYFKNFKNIRGFVIRITGFHFIVKENKGTEKLIEIFNR
jgi:hypothetical protein